MRTLLPNVRKHINVPLPTLLAPIDSQATVSWLTIVVVVYLLCGIALLRSTRFSAFHREMTYEEARAIAVERIAAAGSSLSSIPFLF